MITAELLQHVPLFAPIPESERASLAARAADVRLQAGEWLLREGENAAFFALLDGRLEVVKAFGGHEQRVTVYEPGDYFGEVPLLLGSPAVASLRALEPARVVRLDESDFHDLVSGCPKLNAEVMRTMARRVGHLQQMVVEAPVAQVTVVGGWTDLRCHDLRDFLSRNRIPYAWTDSEAERARNGASADPDGADGRPMVILPGGERLVAPSFAELARAVGLRTAPSGEAFDVVIVGGGPAGLAAAVYGASEGLRTLLVEQVAPGGQAGTSSRIENYLGFPAGVSGDDLSMRARQQAERFGAELVVARRVESLERGSDECRHALWLDGGEGVQACSVVLATGVNWRRLEVPGIDRFAGRGLYYGAARTEARGLRGQRVHLVGGGNSAGQAAMLFASYAEEVTLLVRGASLQATMSQYLIDQLATKANVRVQTRTEVADVGGDDRLQWLELEDRDTGERSTVPSDGLFVFIGAHAETAWLPPQVLRDERGYVCTGRDVLALMAEGDLGAARWPLARDPYLLETSLPGVFAAGDVRHGSIKRVASGVGEGSMAIAFVHQYLAESGMQPAGAVRHV